MALIEFGNLASWQTMTLIGIGIVIAEHQNYLGSTYVLGNTIIPTSQVGIIIAIIGFGLGIFYHGDNIF